MHYLHSSIVILIAVNESSDLDTIIDLHSSIVILIVLLLLKLVCLLSYLHSSIVILIAAIDFITFSGFIPDLHSSIVILIAYPTIEYFIGTTKFTF